MSTKLPKFRITITGDTAEELFENVRGYITWSAMSDLAGGAGVGRDNPPAQVEEEQEDFLTHAAAMPAVPSAPSPSMPTASTDEVDARGFPFDARIHASSRVKTKDGSWRLRRGVEDHQVKAVEQELIAKAKAAHVEQPAPESLRPVVPPAPVVQPAQHPVAPPIPHVPPPAPAPVVIPNAHTVETFKKHLVQVLAKLVIEKKLDQPYIQTLKNHFEVAEIHQIDDEQAAELFELLATHNLIQRA